MGPELFLHLLTWAGIPLFVAVVVLSIRRGTRAYALPTLVLAAMIGVIAGVGSLPEHFASIFFAFFAIGAIGVGGVAAAIGIIVRIRARKRCLTRQ